MGQGLKGKAGLFIFLTEKTLKTINHLCPTLHYFYLALVYDIYHRPMLISTRNADLKEI